MANEKFCELELAEVSINNECNLNCKHCSHVIKSNGHHKLSLNDWIRIATQLIDLGVKRIHICGKEPLLSPWLEEFIKTLDLFKQGRDFKYGLVTNGTLLKENLCWISSYSIDYVDVSIDGLRLGHDFLRGSGSFARTKQQVKAALQVLGGDRINITTVVFKHNIKEIVQMLEEFNLMGVKYFFIQPIQNIGRARRNSNLFISANDYRWLIEEISTNRVFLDCLIELFVDYSQKNHLFKSCELFQRTCKIAASGESISFKIPMGRLQLTANWYCYAYKKSIMITPFGEFLGCSMQASSSRSMGPSGGYVAESQIAHLVRGGILDQCLREFALKLNDKQLNNFSNSFGINKCPIVGLKENILKRRSNGNEKITNTTKNTFKLAS